MKHPKPRGSAINMARMRSWTITFAGYRHVINEARIDRWLSQFQKNDKDIAARILDCVEFVSNEQMTYAFRAILNGLDSWNKDETLRRGRWRFVAFSGSSGESGDSMVHKFRHANGLSSTKYNKLFIYRSDLLKENLGSNDTVVFIDDFSGSGSQVCNGWPEIEELLPGQPTTYLVLVGVNATARRKISDETNLQIASHFDYDERDNIFSPTCIHFTDEEKETILKYCKRADKRLPKGRGECGMVLIFAHNSPNNSIPILHVNRERWEGLFRRYD